MSAVELQAALQAADAKFQADDLQGAEDAYSALEIEGCEDVGVRLQAYNNRGALRIARGENSKAAEDFQAALKLKPKEADIWYNLGAAQRNSGDVEESLVSFDKCTTLRAEPSYICLCSRSEALSSLGRQDEAINEAGCAIRLEPNSSRGYTASGFAKLKLKNHKEAINAFSDAIRFGDKTAFEFLALAHSGYADEESRLAKFDTSIKAYIKALDLTPLAHNVRYNYAITLRNAKKTDAAVAELRRVVAAEPFHSEATYALAVTLLQQGNADEAEPFLVKAIELAPGEVDRLYNMAVLKQKLQDYDGAVATLETVLASEPKHEHALAAMASLRE